MFADITPIMVEFVKQFVSGTEKIGILVPDAAHSTATMTRAVLSIPVTPAKSKS
jgi:phospholipid N-methyltransferase